VEVLPAGREWPLGEHAFAFFACGSRLLLCQQAGDERRVELVLVEPPVTAVGI